MIAATSSAFAGSPDFRLAGGRAPHRCWRLAVMLAAEAVTPPAPRPDPRPIATALDALLSDGAPVSMRPAALEARRGFGAGNGFLPGQIVDRAV
jgi:hypothetical protein